MNQKNEIRKKAFSLATTGKIRIMCILEGAIICAIPSLAFSAIVTFLAFKNSVFEPTSAIAGIHLFVIFVTIGGSLMGAWLGSRNYYQSAFVWRFFKSNQKNIKMYLDKERDRTFHLMLLNDERIKYLNNEKVLIIPNKIRKIREDNKNLGLDFESLESNAQKWFNL